MMFVVICFEHVMHFCRRIPNKVPSCDLLRYIEENNVLLSMFCLLCPKVMSWVMASKVRIRWGCTTENTSYGVVRWGCTIEITIKKEVHLRTPTRSAFVDPCLRVVPGAPSRKLKSKSMKGHKKWGLHFHRKQIVPYETADCGSITIWDATWCQHDCQMHRANELKAAYCEPAKKSAVFKNE